MSEPTEQQVEAAAEYLREKCWTIGRNKGRQELKDAIAAALAAAPRRAEGPNNAGAILVRLRYAILTATNDDLSEPGTEKRTRHIARIEAMHDAMEEIVSLCAAAGLTVGEKVPSKEG